MTRIQTDAGIMRKGLDLIQLIKDIVQTNTIVKPTNEKTRWRLAWNQHEFNVNMFRYRIEIFNLVVLYNKL